MVGVDHNKSDSNVINRSVIVNAIVLHWTWNRRLVCGWFWCILSPLTTCANAAPSPATTNASTRNAQRHVTITRTKIYAKKMRLNHDHTMKKIKTTMVHGSSDENI